MAVVTDEAIEVEYRPDELERRRERDRARKRAWLQKNRSRANSQARSRYRQTHYRVCPGTAAESFCGVELTAKGSVRCDRHAHQHAKALARAAYRERKNRASND